MELDHTLEMVSLLLGITPDVDLEKIDDKTINQVIRGMLSLEKLEHSPLDSPIEAFNIMTVIQKIRFGNANGSSDFVDTTYEEFSNIISRHPTLALYSMLWDMDDEQLETIVQIIDKVLDINPACLLIMFMLLIENQTQ